MNWTQRCRSSLTTYAHRFCSTATSSASNQSNRAAISSVKIRPQYPTYTSADTTTSVNTSRAADLSQKLTPITRKPYPLKELTRNTTGPYEADGLPKPFYPKRKSPYKRTTAVINALAEEETLRLKQQGRAVLAQKLPNPMPGQIVRIAYVTSLKDDQTLQYFCGIVIAIRKRLLGSTIILRNVVEGVAVERGFAMYSPLVKDVWVVGQRKVRKNKLYFLRNRPLRDSVVQGATKKQEE